MPTLQQTIRALGGIAARRELLARGHSDDEIRIFARGGSIERVRNGWYTVPGADEDTVRAWRVGGRLACVSALDQLQRCPHAVEAATTVLLTGVRMPADNGNR